MMYVFPLELAFFFKKTKQLSCFCALYSATEIKVFEAFPPKFSNNKVTVCNNGDQTCFLMHFKTSTT